MQKTMIVIALLSVGCNSLFENPVAPTDTTGGSERWFPSFRQLSGQIKVKSGFIDQAASGCDEVGQSPGLGAAPTWYASSGVRSPSDECGRRLL